MNKFFAVTTRGLESISAEEMDALPGVTVDQIAYRRITATVARSPAPLLTLRTVDDVFFDVAAWRGVGRSRATLEGLRALSAQLDLYPALGACAQVRPIPDYPAFSVTANFVGQRNYSTEEIKRACAEGIAMRHGWPYTPDDREAALNVRLFIEHDAAFVGARLAAEPLHRRPYKRVHVPASLKPPVAAALLRWAQVETGELVLDPCCGAGTILIEAALIGARAWGGDKAARALAAARANIDASGVPASVHRWDAKSLPLADASTPYVVSNLPWGREVTVGVALPAFYRRVCAEIDRVVAPGGRVVLLTGRPELLALDDLRLEGKLEISLFGQTPTAFKLAKD